ncbi:MAG: Hcp family type VI secretion system effector [Janthinobacterium lividum]
MDTIVLSIDSISGNSTLKEFPGKIIVDSFSHGVAFPLGMDVANTERTKGRPVFSEISLSKMTDVSTPAIYMACAAGTKLGDATLNIGRNEGGKFMPLVKYVLGNAMISNINTSGGGGGAMDSFSINFTKITIEYSQQNPDASKKGSSTFGWDISTNSAS